MAAPPVDVPYAVYLGSCPNCGGPISSLRLARGLPCSRCLPGEPEGHLDVVRALEGAGRLEGLRRVAEVLARVEEFRRLFRAVVGFDMWGAQRLWARRLAKEKSFAIVAPTGSGKTTFVLVAALHYAGKGGRVLLVFPTSALAHQAERRLREYAERAGLAPRIVAYHSLLSEREKEEAKAAIEEGRFDVLVVTSAFLSRYEGMLRPKFDLVAVDDVDSVLRATSRNVERILRLLGVPQEVLDRAMELVELVRRRARAQLFGEETGAMDGRIEELRREIREAKERGGWGIFLASGALARARRTARLLLFRELLGFDVGGRAEGLRKVVDLYEEVRGDGAGRAVELVERLGAGGIIYIQDRELWERIREEAERRGLKVEHFLRPRRGLLERFERGEVQALVGLASSRSALVRGIDMPHVIKYAIFVGVPKFEFRIRLEEFSVPAYLTFLYNVRPILSGELRREADRLIGQLKRLAPYGRAVAEALAKEGELSGFERHAREVAQRAVDFVSRLLADVEVRKALESTEVRLRQRGGEFYVVVPDVTAYIQASGRTSRLYAGGLSTGVSIVLVDDQKVFAALRRELRLRFDEAEFKPLDEGELEDLVKAVEGERETIRKIMRGELRPSGGADLMRTVLVVVESPTKARTIANFFGRPSVVVTGSLPTYEVSTGDRVLLITASLGHVYDLPTSLRPEDEGAICGELGLARCFRVREEGGREYDAARFAVVLGRRDGRLEVAPVYGRIMRCRDGVHVEYVEGQGDCFEVVSAIRDLATEVDEVYLATDPDSEGEKIAGDIYLQLRPYVANIYRMEFHEVTRRAVMEAMAGLHGVNWNRVASQVVRRVEDRWLGFGLSGILQREFDRRDLSAGRVQTPVLGWIVEGYQRSKGRRQYDVKIRLGEAALWLRLREEELERLRTAERATLKVLERKRKVVKPPPPYTTDELLRDAVRRLRIPAERAMQIAQDLFESGFITYHRTDSTRVSQAGLAIAREYISKRFGPSEFKARPWSAGGEEGAHEAIRPTRPVDVEELRGLVNAGVIQPAIRMTRAHYDLYDLIFRRFMASQMRPSVVVTADYVLEVGGLELKPRELRGVVVEVERPGFQSLYPLAADRRLPEGEVELRVESARRHYRLYTQADILSRMRQERIGRPSTYARILQVLSRRYVYVVPGVNLMKPLRRGIDVYRRLSRRFRDMVSVKKTRQVEEYMDEVEAGRRNYQEVLEDLYRELSSRILPYLESP